MWADNDAVAYRQVEFDEVDALDGFEREERANSAATLSVLTSQELNETMIGGNIFDAILLENLARTFVVHAGH